MNRAVKGGIAAGVAGLLLLGGAGTYALWQSDQTVYAGTVDIGQLKLALAATGTWTDTSLDATTTTFTPATDKIVPQDTLVFSQAVTITADGKNLHGQLTNDPSTLDAALGTAAPDIAVTAAA